MRQPRSALRRWFSLIAAVPLVAVLVVAGFAPALASSIASMAAAAPAPAVFVPPTSTQFDIDGLLQSATLDPACAADAHCGGTLLVNGQTVTVPKETIVILPANALTWQELFTGAQAPYAPTQTGMAMSDMPAPAFTYEVHVVGNRVGDTYIAGLIDIAQNGLNGGAGYINYIDYATGEFRVGGTIGSSTTGARVQLNDPLGRFGRVMSADPRFTVDADNPTILAATGFPMCIPRTDPAVADDALCPQANRPGDGAGGFAIAIQMNDPVNLPGVFPDATKQAPMEIGDYVSFAGTMETDANGTFVSAHTVVNNAAIYTWPGTSPAYVSVEVTIIGTGGLTVIGAGEAAIRTRFEGMTTDPSRGIHLYGVDVNPVTGATSDRDWGTIGVDQGPPIGAVKGRWRFRPPCLPFGSVPTKPDKECVMGPDGVFIPPTREVRAVIEGLQSQNPANPNAVTYANGIYAGQYHAPILEYIFPENIPGSPIVPNNFEAIPFLACGGYTSAGGTLAGQLNPWPGAAAPNCPKPPVANSGGPYTVNSGATVTLNGTSTGSTPLTFAWASPAQGSLSSTSVAGPVYTAPQVSSSTVVNLSLTVTNAAGSDTSNTTVTINPASAPTVDPIAAQSVVSGSSGTFAVTGSDPNVPAHTPLTFQVTQTAGAVTLTGLAVTSSGATGANVAFTAPTGVTTATDVTLAVTATNTAGVVSAPVAVTVTVNPAAIVCVAPTASTGGPYTVASGGTVNLTGSATGTIPLTFLWAAPSSGTISPLNAASATYTAPQVAADTTVNISLTATNDCGGSNTASSTVLVKAALAPSVAQIAPVSVFSGANGTFSVSGSDPNTPALLPLTFSATQSGAPALVGLTVAQTPPTGATVSFTAPTLPVGQTTNATVTVTVKAANSLGILSAGQTVTVTVKPLPDSVTITNAEYRTGKQRLIITATSSVVSPNVVLTLLPYVTTTGSTFTPPDGTFTNGGGGLYTITLVGVPQPAAGLVLQVKSNLGGLSPLHALDRVRA